MNEKEQQIIILILLDKKKNTSISFAPHRPKPQLPKRMSPLVVRYKKSNVELCKWE